MIWITCYIIILIIITIVMTITNIHNERKGDKLDIIVVLTISIFNFIIIKTKFFYLVTYNGIENGYYGGGVSLETYFLCLAPPIIMVLIASEINYIYKKKKCKKMIERLKNPSQK